MGIARDLESGKLQSRVDVGASIYLNFFDFVFPDLVEFFPEVGIWNEIVLGIKEGAGDENREIGKWVSAGSVRACVYKNVCCRCTKMHVVNVTKRESTAGMRAHTHAHTRTRTHTYTHTHTHNRARADKRTWYRATLGKELAARVPVLQTALILGLDIRGSGLRPMR